MSSDDLSDVSLGDCRLCGCLLPPGSFSCGSCSICTTIGCTNLAYHDKCEECERNMKCEKCTSPKNIDDKCSKCCINDSCKNKHHKILEFTCQNCFSPNESDVLGVHSCLELYNICWCCDTPHSP